MTSAALHTRTSASPWTTHLVALGAALAVIAAIRAGDLAHMAAIWWTSSTYAHCLLLLPILAWLVAERVPALRTVHPAIWPAAAMIPALGVLAILFGDAGGIATLRHAGLVTMLAGAVPTLLGRSAGRVLLFPLLYAGFLVPMGEELVPALQLVTAHICMALLGLLGIPAHLEGVFITVPYGAFEVAEACSGAKFLIAMAALAVLVAELCFRAWPRRVAFVLFATIASVLANGLRAFATIWVARHAGVEAATGFDHLVYGWFFFAAVIALTLGVAWPFFDRNPLERPAVGNRARTTDSIAPAPWAFGVGALALLPSLWLSAPQAGSLPAMRLPTARGWTLIESKASPAWRPHFASADALTTARFRDGGGAEVEVVLAGYRAQAEGRELVGFGQGVDADWSWSGSGAPVASGRADRFVGEGLGREVLTFYRVGDFTTGQARDVKLATLAARLTRRSSAGAAFLVSSAAPGPPAASRPAIDRFLRAAGGADAFLPR